MRTNQDPFRFCLETLHIERSEEKSQTMKE